MSSTAPPTTLAPQNPATVLLLLVRDVLAPALALALAIALVLAAVLSMTIVSVSMLTTPAHASVVEPATPSTTATPGLLAEAAQDATDPGPVTASSRTGSGALTAGLMLVGFTVIRALTGVVQVRGNRSAA